MSADVIQHQRSRRKRAGAWSWTMQHFGVLAVVMIGVFAASWLAPDMVRPPAPVTVPTALPPTAEPPLPPQTLEVDIRADLAAPTRPRVQRVLRPAGVPLNATSTLRADDFEILSAAELDGISQARN